MPESWPALDVNVTFKRLTQVREADLIDLMNHPLVRRQMPLMPPEFGKADCEAFTAAKEAIWTEHGYGPWAFFVAERFVGWGGLQPEDGDVDLGLVLHPDYWGLGRSLYATFVRQAFGPMGLESVTVLLPVTRTRVRGMLRLGFERVGDTKINGEHFVRYRLRRAPVRQRPSFSD